MKNCLMSFIIPVYNAVNCLETCVNSIVNAKLKSFEILLIDDCSTDGSGALCDSFAEKYIEIRAFHQAVNQGPGAARNIGIRQAKGDYLLFVDADDFLITEKLPALERFLNQNGKMDLIVFGVYWEMNNQITPKLLDCEGKTSFTCGEFLTNYSNHLNYAVWRFAFNSAFVKEQQISFPQRYFAEDRAFLTEAFLHCTSIFYFPHCLYHYHAVGRERLFHETRIELACQEECAQMDTELKLYEKYLNMGEQYSYLSEYTNRRLEETFAETIWRYAGWQGRLTASKTEHLLGTVQVKLLNLIQSGEKSQPVYITPVWDEAVCLAMRLREYTQRPIVFLDRNIESINAYRENLSEKGFESTKRDGLKSITEKDNILILLLTGGNKRLITEIGDELSGMGYVRGKHFFTLTDMIGFGGKHEIA